MKQVIIGGFCLILGAAGAIGIFFAKNHSRPEPVITIAKKETGFTPTRFSLEEAPSESIRGTIATMSGSIWHQDRTATEPAQLVNPLIIQQGETLIASESGYLTVDFNSALTLSLFPNTKVEVIQTLPLNLVFNQTKGVGQYQTSGNSIVTVRSLNLIVNLEDGLLVVDTDEVTGKIMLGLKTGKAKVGYNSSEFESRVWDLQPGDVFEYDSHERQGYFNASL